MHPIRPFSSIFDLPPEEYQELPSSTQGTLVERNVRWLRNQYAGSSARKALSIAVISSEVAFLTFSIVGIYGLHALFAENKKQSNIKTFFEHIQTIPPPQITDVIICTPQQTKNFVSEFVIHNAVIWTKRIGQDAAAWQPVYFDGFPTRTPIEISADGGRLIVIDNQTVVHKKDILEEKWKNGVYQFTDISQRPNWSKPWFTLPVLSTLVNLITGQELRLGHYSAMAASGRGVFNHHYEDGAGRTHVDTNGATTLYALSADETHLSMWDPWVPSYVSEQIPSPTFTNGHFSVLQTAGSASSIMQLGYKPGVHAPQELSIFTTNTIDFDTIGWNPFLPDTYNPNETCDKVQVLPRFEWTEHTLPPNAQALMSGIDIRQIGQGNGAREMRILGINEQGRQGFFYKNIFEPNWSFQETPIPLQPHLQLTQPIADPRPPIIHDWAGVNSSLSSFGPLSVSGTLSLTIDQAPPVHLRIHRKENPILKAIGASSRHYDLVIPETDNPHIKEYLHNLFGKKPVIGANIVFTDQTVTISSRGFTTKPFTITLNKQ